jgi:hypothetical protein
MSSQQSRWSSFGISDIECADNLINASGCNDSVAVFVPVVRQSFGGCEDRARIGYSSCSWYWSRTVDGEQVDEVIRCGGRSSQIEYTEVGVGGDGGDNRW